MKKPVLTLFILLNYAYAQEIRELNDKELSKKFVSIVKDTQIQSMLEKTAEFNDCRKDSEFKASDDDQQRQKKIIAAQDCFSKKLPKDEASLKKLSDNLALQSYGLVSGKNTRDISNYLANKMYKAMTGVDRETNDIQKMIESLKFKNKKLVDQKDFIDLYVTQLGKNALFEISRYCFEDFRNKTASSTATDWASHWGSTTFDDKSLKNVTDTGGGSFFSSTSATSNSPISDKSAIYQDILKGLSSNGSTLNAKDIGDFFSFCSNAIPILCEKYEAKFKGKSFTATSTSGAMSEGAKSCIVKARLQEIRKTISNAQLVMKEFEKMDGQQLGVVLDQGKPLFYDRNADGASIDALTNKSSVDMLETTDQQNEITKNKIDECKKNPRSADCEKYLSIGDDFAKAQYNTELAMTLKREVEIARIVELKKKGDQSYENYMKENGYFDVMTKVENGGKLEEELAAHFDAQRNAQLEALRSQVGKRQISEKDAKNSPTAESDAIEKNMLQTKDERARLAQVVLFNNIITSNLTLQKKDSNNNYIDVGRNVSAWKNEEKALQNAKVIDGSLFSNIKDTVKNAKAPDMKDNAIVGVGILDGILGCKEEKNEKCQSNNK